MSLARQRFLEDISALKDALALEPIAAGSTGAGEGRGLAILRRGMLITGLIALETFVRDRTAEVLEILANWPASYQDLPVKLREAALLDALPNLQRYAKMLKRQEEDYESLLIDQISRMGMTKGPVFGFTKFTSGDYTGNISDTSLKDLLSGFQIKDCWNQFRLLSADAGIGVPSVHELIKEAVRNRHKSAHSPDYTPTVADIRSITLNLTCIGFCFDVSMSVSAAYALHDWKRWAEGDYNWREQVRLFFLDVYGEKFRLRRFGRKKALRVLDKVGDAAPLIPASSSGAISVLVTRDDTERPQGWKIF